MEKYKDLVLKRCVFEDVGFNGSLEGIISHIISNLPNHDDRVFDGGLMFKTFRLASAEQMLDDKGLFVRVVALNQNPIGVVDLKKSTTTLGVDEQAPPTDSEWLEEDIFLLVKNNDLISCLTGRKDRVLEHMIWKLGMKAQVIANDFKFKIGDVPNRNELEKVNKIGVRSVNFDIHDYLSNLTGLKDVDAPAGIKGDMSSFGDKIVSKIFSQPDTDNGKRKRANTSGKIVLSRGKFKKSENRKDEWLTDIGQTLVESGDTDYTLVLEDKSVISTKDLKISKRIKVKTHANTICPDRTREELLQYHSELARDGMVGG